MQGWLYLIVAVVAEVIATSALKSSHGFTRLWPTVTVVLGYGGAFYLLSLTLRYLPLGITYAVWAGLGVVLTTLIGWALFQQRLDGAALLGIGCILAGVMIMNVFSSTAMH